MILGSRTRRIASGFVACLIGASMAGCQAVPFTRLTTAPNRPQSALAVASRATLLPATVALDNPAEMSSIEPTGAGTGMLEPSPGLFDPSRTPLTAYQPAPEPATPAPTPLLDAALERAKVTMTSREAAKAFDLPMLGPIPSNPNPNPAPPSAPTPEPPAVVASPAAASTPSPSPTKDQVAGHADEAPPAPPRPEDVWRDGVRKLVALARGRQEQPGGSKSAWSLRARVLSWLAEPDLDPDLAPREADGLRSVLKVLDDAPAESPGRAEEVRAAVQVIEDKAPLEIVELKLCSRVDGFCDYVAFEPPVRKAGETVVIYCELDGVRHAPTSTGYRTRLAGQVEILPGNGGPAILVQQLLEADETCKRRRRDYYIAYKIELNKTLRPGQYRFRLVERDMASDQSASREVPFTISRD